MKKETAVEALSEYIRIVDKKVYADLKEIIEQCKQMEKEQISNAYMNSTAQFANDARIDFQNQQMTTTKKLLEVTMNYNELKSLIIDWANQRELIKRENSTNQYLKFLEEVGETAKALLKDDSAGVIDGFGDIAVTMIILGEQIGNSQELSDTYKPIGFINLHDVVRRVGPDFVNPSAMNFLNDACFFYGLDLVQCLEVAWEEIKDRKGKTINGTFIKN